MVDPIVVGKARYYPCADLHDGSEDAKVAADVQSRQSFISSRKVKLDRTSGAFVVLGGRPLLLVIDLRTVGPGSDEWRFIGTVGTHLESHWQALSVQAKAALSTLKAVIFTTAPARAYADVKRSSFVYDVDEFQRSDGSLISAAYASSNIVHDANHVWMFEHRQPYTGVDAEKTCWRLQIANAEALEIDPWDVDFLRGLIDDPAQVAMRIDEDPLARSGCDRLGHCPARGRSILDA